MRLAYVSPTIPGTYWMRLNVNGKIIRFRLIERNFEQNQIIASIQVPLLDSKLTLNEILARRGLAKADSLAGQNSLKIKNKLFDRIETCQKRAKKEGLGIWSETMDQTLRWYQIPFKIISQLFLNLKNK